jgi:hypothetical protein
VCVRVVDSGSGTGLWAREVFSYYTYDVEFYM